MSTGPREGDEGVVEEVKGTAKKVAGSLSGDEELEREGRAQQDKADAKREAAKREAEAERARAEAQLHESRERKHQE
ncbi:MAG: CsbD family protein [Actinomycetota bacterium]|nr:CsbD family protein [Actinomycetota bacterium]